MRVRTLCVGAAVVLLAACAAPQGAGVDPAVAAAATEPLFCRGADQCQRYWRRAQLWVAKNSRWKIQTATDVLIETYGSPRSSTDRAYQVLREPGPGGVERIVIRSGCGNMFGCSTNELEVAAQFKTYVRAAD